MKSLGGGGELVHPLWPGGKKLHAGKSKMRAVFSLRFLQLFRQHDKLNLLYVIAIKEKLDTPQDRFAAIDLHVSPRRLGSLSRRRCRRNDHAERCHANSC